LRDFVVLNVKSENVQYMPWPLASFSHIFFKYLRATMEDGTRKRIDLQSKIAVLLNRKWQYFATAFIVWPCTCLHFIMLPKLSICSISSA